MHKVETSLTALNTRPKLLAKRVNIKFRSTSVGCMLGYLNLRFSDCGWRNHHAHVAG